MLPYQRVLHADNDRPNQINPCHAEYIEMLRPLLIFNQSDYWIQIIDINSNT